MIQRCLANRTSALSFSSSGTVDNQYWVGSACSLGHSINSHSGGCGSLRSESRWAARVRTAAKREGPLCLVPCRHDTFFHAGAGSDTASSFTDTGCCCWPRCRNWGGRPLPFHCGLPRGPSPGFHTVTEDMIPTP